MMDLIALGNSPKQLLVAINKALQELDLPVTIVEASSAFTDGEILTADGNARNAKSSGKKIVTLDINYDLNHLNIPQTSKETVPSTYSVAYAVREAMPVWIGGIHLFAKGKDLYSPGHEDYNKLIAVFNSRGYNMTVNQDYPDQAIRLATLLDRGYMITNVTHGLYSPLVTFVYYNEKYIAVNGDVNDKVKQYTIKLDIDASKQDSLMTSAMDGNEPGIFVWVSKPLAYEQPFFIE